MLPWQLAELRLQLRPTVFQVRLQLSGEAGVRRRRVRLAERICVISCC